MKTDLITSLYVFMLAGFIGFEVIRRVSPLLHTPLMSLTNALDAIAVVAAKRPVARVPGQRHVARRALEDEPAILALDDARVAAAIEEHQRLVCARHGWELAGAWRTRTSIG